jgi:exosortase
LDQIAKTATLGMALLWAYWSTLADIAERWSEDPRYAHGYLVPAFSVALLWTRRPQVSALTGSSPFAGLSCLIVAAGMRLLGSYIYFDWLDAVSLLPCLAGLSLLAGGRRYLRWCWQPIGFLIFMIPLPYRLELALGGPMQRLATEVSTFCLQTIGIPALSRGNVIAMSTCDLGIVEACSGLSMMVLFFAFSTAVAILARRPWIDTCLLVVSALPIAIAANIMRITVTGVILERFGKTLAHVFYHDLAGWLMMPFALVLLAVELKLLSLLFREQSEGISSMLGKQAAHIVPTAPGAHPRHASGKAQ